MTSVVASVSASVAIPQRIVGHVSKKDNVITIEYKKPGMVKTSKAVFTEDDTALLGWMTGEAGFVIALVNDPVAVVFGTMSTKNGRTLVESEAGKVVLKSSPAVLTTFAEADENSKEARLAARASKVKGVKIKKDKGDKKKSKKKDKDRGEKKKKKSKK